MYKCKPERNVAQARLIAIPGTALPAVLFVASAAVPKYGSYIKLLSFAMICVTIMLLVRYVLSEYEYSVDGESFSVTRITGARRTVMCSISLASAVALLPESEYRALPAGEKAIIKYSLNQNVRAQSYVFLCDFNGKRTMVEFEPNEPFAAIVKEQIEAAKRNGGNDPAPPENPGLVS